MYTKFVHESAGSHIGYQLAALVRYGVTLMSIFWMMKDYCKDRLKPG